MKNYVGYVLLFVLVVVAFQWPKIKEKLFGDQIPEAAFHWEHDFSAAQKLATDQNKPLMMVFSASWCPPCKQMKREVWPDAAVGELVTSSYVPLYVDIDESQNDSLSQKYQVNSIPAVFIVQADGSVVRKAQYLSRSEALAFLK